MTLLLGLPALAAIAAGGIVWKWSNQFRADLAAKLLAATWMLATLTIVTAIALYAVAWMVPAEHALWCRQLLGHSADHRPVAGIILLSVLTVVSLRVGWVTRKIVRMWQAEVLGRSCLDIEQSDIAYAFSVPQVFRKRSLERGSIVVSTAMLDSLTEPERSALFAHERAHLRYGHHRYLLTGQVLVAVLPPLRPMINRLSWLLERWADETAAREVGDRRVVATAIAHAALSTTSRQTPMFLAFGSDSVVARVEAMLQPPRSRSIAVSVALMLSVTTAALAALTQLHHLVSLVGQMAR